MFECVHMRDARREYPGEGPHMQFWRFNAAVAAAAVLAVAPAAALAAPHVGVAQGMLEGASADGVDSFKGVPFAAPPVGALRWRPPAAPASWTAVREATA